MRSATVSCLALVLLGGCTTGSVPDGASILTGAELAQRLSGQRLVIQAPEESGFDAELTLIARLRSDGIAEMSAQLDGEPSEFFEDTERWTTQGQKLCIFSPPAPEDSDCIRVDWVDDNRIQLTEIRPSGERQTSMGRLDPL